jgi:acetolactate synthase I/II/III large subunit
MESPELGSHLTAANRLLRLAAQLDIKYIFTNLGSDHPAFIEAFAELHQSGQAMPQVIICPHEMTALSAAHGYAMITKKAQMVLVHVDVGTQNLGCSVHNAARARIPAIIVAGLSPTSVFGDQVGARTEFIHYTQDTSRQHEIVSQYMKWCYEARSPEMMEEVLLRGHQIASSLPQGPVYITGTRELWEGRAKHTLQALNAWAPAALPSVGADELAHLAKTLAQAQRPLIITSYLGRNTESVNALIQIVDLLGVAVCEVNPHYMNFPGDHVCHIGYRRNSLVNEADVIVLIDVDVPWIVSKVAPNPTCQIFHIDSDPLKRDFGFWHFPSHHTWTCDSHSTLSKLLPLIQAEVIETQDHQTRMKWIANAKIKLKLQDMPTPSDGAINIQQLSEAIKELVNDKTVIVFEEPTATERLQYTLKMSRPGSYLANGGSGLGWSINAAIGVKLADPQAEVITVVGDGSYIFGVPSSCYWVGETYRAPQLTIVFNNKGWNAPKASTLLVHPEGVAKNTDHFWITVSANTKFADLAKAAGNALAIRVEKYEDLKTSLALAMQTVRAGQSAVVDVVTLPISKQILGTE